MPAEEIKSARYYGLGFSPLQTREAVLRALEDKSSLIRKDIFPPNLTKIAVPLAFAVTSFLLASCAQPPEPTPIISPAPTVIPTAEVKPSVVTPKPEDFGQVVAPDGLPVPGEANIPVGTQLKVEVVTDPANPNLVKSIKVTTPGGRTLELSDKDLARLKLSDQALKDAKPYIPPTPTKEPTPLPPEPTTKPEFVRAGFSTRVIKSDTEYPSGPFLVRMPWADKTGNDSYADFSQISPEGTRELARRGWERYTPEYIQKQIDNCQPLLKDHCIWYWSQFGDITNPLGMKVIGIMHAEDIPYWYRESREHYERSKNFIKRGPYEYGEYPMTIYNLEVEEIEYYAAPLYGNDPNSVAVWGLYSRGKFKDVSGKEAFIYFGGKGFDVFASVASAPLGSYEFVKIADKVDPRMLKKGMIVGFVDGSVSPFPFFDPEPHLSPEMLKNFEQNKPTVTSGGIVLYFTPYDMCCRP